MNLEIKKYLYDIKISIESIEEFLGNKRDFKIYLSDKLLRRAVEREIEIIGEATNRILKTDNTILIESSRKIVDTRNFIIHACDSVDDTIIWGIVTLHLPKLKLEVDKLLSK